MNAAWWHHYVMLTKRPDLVEPEELLELYAGPMNGDLICGGFWLGVSITCDDDWWRVERLAEIKHAEWGIGAVVSAEPLLGPITHEIPGEISWVIVGAQTGAGADDVRPEWEWVGRIAWEARDKRVPVFEKDNLEALAWRKLGQQWPEAMELETGGVVARDDGRLSAPAGHPPAGAPGAQRQRPNGSAHGHGRYAPPARSASAIR